MAMPKAQPGGFTSLSGYFRLAEGKANDIRKLLKAQAERGCSCAPGFMEDAVDLATTAETLAAAGRDATAEDAMILAELVELMLEELAAKVRQILVS